MALTVYCHRWKGCCMRKGKWSEAFCCLWLTGRQEIYCFTHSRQVIQKIWGSTCFGRFTGTFALIHVRSTWAFSSPPPHSGELRTRKLKSHLVRTQSLNVLSLKPGVGQYIAIHATLTARDLFLAYFYPTGPFTCI